MKCEQGDIAKIIEAVNPGNKGKIVIVSEYIGKFSAYENFDYRGVVCVAPVADHYWWISADYGLKNYSGETPQAYIADSWLDPIRPTKIAETTDTELELTS